MRGRKHLIKLQIGEDGKVKVLRDSNMDVILMHPDSGNAENLTPRPQVILEQKDGKVTAKEVPANTKVEIVGEELKPEEDEDA